MDESGGAVGTSLPGAAPGAAGPAVHHEQTVGEAALVFVAPVAVQFMEPFIPLRADWSTGLQRLVFFFCCFLLCNLLNVFFLCV